jgi:REP element-mobilizing transposase RayT
VEQPLVIAYHLIWTAYGWWLPNDPRGSGSKAIDSDIIAQLGELHRGRKRVQPPGSVVRDFYDKAAKLLRHQLLKFDESARAVVADAFKEVIQEERYTCYACAVMPDHVHILIRKHKDKAEVIADRLKSVSRLRLCESGHRPDDHPTWCGGCVWHIFLDHPDEVRRTIGYIERNPLAIGLPAQPWPFITPYDNWPFHPGHSPNSPYAKRLRAAGRL